MSPKVGKMKVGLWHFVKSFFSKKDPNVIFYVVYPPLDETPIHIEKCKPWEWVSEPEEYHSYWEAKLHADKINLQSKRIIAIVVVKRIEEMKS